MQTVLLLHKLGAQQWRTTNDFLFFFKGNVQKLYGLVFVVGCLTACTYIIEFARYAVGINFSVFLVMVWAPFY